MLWILQYDPEKRPSLSQIKSHPWMQKQYSYEGARQKLLNYLKTTKASEPQSDAPKEKVESKTPAKAANHGHDHHNSAYQQRAPLASTMYDNKGYPVNALSKTPSRVYINKTPGGHQQQPPSTTFQQR